MMLTAVLLAACINACSGHEGDVANAQQIGDSHYAIVPESKSPYEVVPVSSVGRVTGIVVMQGTPRQDTAAFIPEDKNGCAKPLSMTYLTRSQSGGVRDAIVWLPELRKGRALPSERRYRLVNSGCAWDSMVQVVAENGTLNVANLDPLVDKAYIRTAVGGNTVAEAPFTDAGQVIPFDQILKRTGVYEFSTASRPLSRSWIMVLDHPYFAMTGDNGAFALEGVPAGTHSIRVWHPVLGVAHGTVTVTADAEATVTLKF